MIGRRPGAIVLALIPAVALAGPADPPRHALRTTEGRLIEATLSTEVLAPQLRAEEWSAIAPRPPDGPGQEVREARFSPGGEASRERGEASRPFLSARIASDASKAPSRLVLKAEYRIALKRRTLVRLGDGEPAPAVPALDGLERRLALAPSSDCDFRDPGLAKWLDEHGLRRTPDESDVDFGRRVFVFLKRNFQYEYTDTMDRRSSRVCRLGRSDCGGLGLLFVAAMRASGVPARTIVGRWATSAEAGAKAGGLPYYQQHAKAEFFAEGVGWVPVDPASAIVHDRSPEGLAYFGIDDGDFITYHHDTRLRLDSRFFGEQTVETLQGLVFWARGKGTFEDAKVTETWTVREIAR